MQLRKKCLFVLLHVIVVTCSREPSSPIRSRFEFEERLLERVLKNELALTTTLNEILKTNAKVVDVLKQDEKTKVESTLALMEKKQIEMESRLSDFINIASKNMNLTLAATMGAMVKAVSDIKENATLTVQQLVNQVHVLKDQLKNPKIYFCARVISSSTISSSHDVVFPTVEVNEGQGYNPATGKFTGSVTGLYLFSVQYCAQISKYVVLEIILTGKTVQRSLTNGGNSEPSCATMQAIIWVDMGNEVWVRTTSTSALFADRHRFTSFSGALIHL